MGTRVFPAVADWEPGRTENHRGLLSCLAPAGLRVDEMHASLGSPAYGLERCDSLFSLLCFPHL